MNAPRIQKQQRILPSDESYTGSTYNSVRDAIFENPYFANWNGDERLPIYPVRLKDLLSGILSRKNNKFLNAAKRTTRSKSDLRWGADLRGQRRLLHPNGVCLTGKWKIEKNPDNDYTGYFASESEGRIIARYSTCCTETRRNKNRSLSLVGKIYPEDPDQLIVPGSFITQEDIGGSKTSHINEATLTNAPTTTIWRRGFGAPILLLTGITLALSDREVSQRQLYSVAELEKKEATTNAPMFMELKVHPSQELIGNHVDFRHEIMAHIFRDGSNTPNGLLKFDIRVSDKLSPLARYPFQKKVKADDWRKIGEIVFDDAVISYNGDFVIHFHHPPWRNDRNDPATVARS